MREALTLLVRKPGPDSYSCNPKPPLGLLSAGLAPKFRDCWTCWHLQLIFGLQARDEDHRRRADVEPQHPSQGLATASLELPQIRALGLIFGSWPDITCMSLEPNTSKLSS